MGSFVIIAVVAILVWGMLRFNRDHNRSEALRAHEEAQARIEAERERDELRERIQVLERIITDEHTPEARERARISDEIESLRSIEDKEETDR